MTEIGMFDDKINTILKTDIPKNMKIYCSEGLEKHLVKQGYDNTVQYLHELESIIKTSDYVGQGKKNGANSFELVKILQENVLVAIQCDIKSGYLYVVSIYEFAVPNC